jgi:hypothetical protein
VSPAKKKAEKSAEPKAKPKRKAKPPPVSLNQRTRSTGRGGRGR